VSAILLLGNLRAAGFLLRVEGGRLHYEATGRELTRDEFEALAKNKQALVEILKAEAPGSAEFPEDTSGTNEPGTDEQTNAHGASSARACGCVGSPPAPAIPAPSPDEAHGNGSPRTEGMSEKTKSVFGLFASKKWTGDW
jgi:hypothetical protein